MSSNVNTTTDLATLAFGAWEVLQWFRETSDSGSMPKKIPGEFYDAMQTMNVIAESLQFLAEQKKKVS